MRDSLCSALFIRILLEKRKHFLRHKKVFSCLREHILLDTRKAISGTNTLRSAKNKVTLPFE